MYGRYATMRFLIRITGLNANKEYIFIEIIQNSETSRGPLYMYHIKFSVRKALYKDIKKYSKF